MTAIQRTLRHKLGQALKIVRRECGKVASIVAKSCDGKLGRNAIEARQPQHFGRIGVVGQEFHPVAIQVEAIDRRHLNTAVELRVVFLFDPLVRQPVEETYGDDIKTMLQDVLPAPEPEPGAGADDDEEEEF